MDPAGDNRIHGHRKEWDLMNVPANVFTRVVDWRTFTNPRCGG